MNMPDETEASTSSTVSIVGQGRRVGWPALGELPLRTLHDRSRFEDVPCNEIRSLVEREASILQQSLQDVDFVLRCDPLN